LWLEAYKDNETKLEFHKTKEKNVKKLEPYMLNEAA
jgi:hypothetical protein